MNPAFSVIFFTVVSGAGYGLMILLGVAVASQPLALGRNEILFALALAALFTVAGLLSSMLHLGQPTRAWRAFSQWRSSWLSREGVASVATFVPLLTVLWFCWSETHTEWLRISAAVLALLALLTLYCTSGIYTSLKTIRAWHNAHVLPGYLLLGGTTGAACLWAIDALSAGGTTRMPLAILTAGLALAAALLKIAYWRFIDKPAAGSTVESATGLGRFGRVRSSEAPHTEENYLTNEMGFRIARKHARRLRRIALLLVGLAPLLFALSLGFVHWPLLVAIAAALCAACVLLGTFVERWLFFAEARHVVMLYYPSERA